MTTKLDSALALAAKGFKVFPIKPGAKSPPLIADWPAKATTDADIVRVLWGKWPTANIGIACDGMAVIDVDTKKGGDDALAMLELVDGFPPTLTTRTPTGGRHLYFKLPDSHPGVSNSVGVLGQGIDIRSAGGYVVAPGSDTPAGSYHSESGVSDVAPAPDWLVQKLGTFTPRERTEKVNVPDAPAAVLERAADWLRTQAPAVEGQGGDVRTFAVVCGLRDYGVSPEQALTLLAPWNSECSPPWSPDDLAAKVRNAYSYGQNAPGGRVASPDEFPVLAATPAPQRRAKLTRFLAFSDSETKGPGYLVKGLLQLRSYAETFGAPGEGKTFVTLDQAYCVAAGEPWMGRKVHQGVALYLAYEGQGGLVKRTQALRKKYGHKDVPLYIVGAAYNLRDVTGRQELGALIAELPEKPVLIVIDTFARALMGGDENSAQDVGSFNAAIAALIESTGACVMIVHHSGKNKSAGARGSSALQGAIDTEIEVDSGRVTASKQRDMESGEPIGFKLVPTMVGLDEDGDDVTSCIVEGAAAAANGPQGRLSGNAKRGFEVLCDLRPDNKPIPDVEWKEACLSFLGNKSATQRFHDLKRQLKTKGFIELTDAGLVTRKCE